MVVYTLLFAFDVPFLGSAFVLEFIAGFAIARRQWWVLPILLLAATTEPRVLAYGTAGAALLWCGVRFEKWFRAPAWRPAAMIGDASYSIYLTHVTVGTLLVGMASAPTAIAACLLAGMLFHLAIERPLLRWCRDAVAGTPARLKASTA